MQYNKRHRVVMLEELNVGDKVWISDIRKYGIIHEKDKSPRSYIIKCADRFYRRNRQFLIKTGKSNLSLGTNIPDDFQCDVDIDSMLTSRNSNQPHVVEDSTRNVSDVPGPSNISSVPGPSRVIDLSVGDRLEETISIESGYENCIEQNSSNSSLNSEEVVEQINPTETEYCEREKRIRKKPNWFGF